jgi:hypothetical protein
LGILYNYRVTAYNKKGSSIGAYPKNPIVILQVPSPFHVAIENKNSAKLIWKDNTSNEAGFIILRAVKPDMQFNPLITLPANTTSYIDNAVTDGSKYFYKVYAFNNSFGLSADTNPDSVLIPMFAPTNLTAVQTANQNKIVLTWKDNSASELG